MRGLSPFPGAWFEVTVDGKLERLRVLTTRAVPESGAPGLVLDDAMTIACGSGAVRVLTAQRAGKKPIGCGGNSAAASPSEKASARRGVARRKISTRR